MADIKDVLADLSAPDAARRLLGWTLTRTVDGRQLSGMIVETEAYNQTDAASHSYTGPVKAQTETAAGIRQQSDHFFRPEVGIATPGQKKIAISPPATFLEDQSEPKLRQGRTPRTVVMFGPPGHLYVYFTYGMHYCCNVVVGSEGTGAAVLIRALQPLTGEDMMERNRRGRSGHDLTNGPAKVCQALVIDKTLNGHDLLRLPLVLEPKAELPQSQIVQTTRIGISQAKDEPWRFYIKDNPWVSHR